MGIPIFPCSCLLKCILILFDLDAHPFFVSELTTAFPSISTMLVLVILDQSDRICQHIGILAAQISAQKVESYFLVTMHFRRLEETLKSESKYKIFKLFRGDVLKSYHGQFGIIVALVWSVTLMLGLLLASYSEALTSFTAWGPNRHGA